MKTRLFQWMMAAILVCGAVLFTSCSSDSDDSWQSDPGIAMIVKSGKIDYWRQVETSFRKSCEEKGLKAYYYSTSAESAYEEQVAAVAELRKIDSKALKGIIFTPCYGLNSESAEAEVAALASERGIPVIILDTPVSAGSPLASYPYYGTDNTAAGKEMAAKVTADDVAVFAIKNGPGMERARAFKELKPNAKIYEVSDKAVNGVEQALIEGYDNFVFFNGSILVDALPMLNKPYINLYTFDVYEEFLNELIVGSTFFKGVMAQNTFGMASKAVDAVLANAKQSEIVPVTYITQYNLDDLNVLPFLTFYGKKAPVIENLAEKLSGKWIGYGLDDGLCLTCDKDVITFLSDTKATISYSKYTFDKEKPRNQWGDHSAFDVVIRGNKVVLTHHINESITLVNEMVINTITDNEIACCYKHFTYIGKEIDTYWENDVTFVKLNVDFVDAVVGTWEGNFGTSEAPQLWRWEFKADGTYVFSSKNGETWETHSDEFAEYFVDGTLLCTRWKNSGAETEEQRDWQEIVSVNDNKMKWFVHGQDLNGQEYTKTVELTKVVE